MERLNMTVREFADHFLPSNAKVKVLKFYEIVFDGTLDELYYYGQNVFSLIVAMVGADEDKVCLSCRE